MTVTYTAEVATCRGFGCFLKLLFRWRGSIYKLVWLDLVCFLLFYYILNFTYRWLLDEHGKKIFESIVNYCHLYSDLIPVSFVLGFYVTVVMTRWWNQYVSIPWPDPIAVFVSANIHGQDERGRLMRRTAMRYVCLCLTMVLTMISPRVKKRFPTLDHLVEAGLLLESERVIMDDLNNKFPKHSKHWLPIVWSASIVTRARKEGRIRDDFAVKTVIDELNKFRGQCGLLISYDTISVPLVYTQVVTLAVYSYFLTAVVAQQWIENRVEKSSVSEGYISKIDIYFPVFITLQFFFYMGWLKVAESLINPFGEDDDDFEVNWMIDRNLQVSYMIVDEMHHEHPELIRDQYWDEVFPSELPYTVATEGSREEHPQPSTAKIEVPINQQGVITVIPSGVKIDEMDNGEQSVSYKFPPHEHLNNDDAVSGIHFSASGGSRIRRKPSSGSSSSIHSRNEAAGGGGGSIPRVNSVTSVLRRIFSKEDTNKTTGPGGSDGVGKVEAPAAPAPSVGSVGGKFGGSMRIADQVIEELDEQNTITSMATRNDHRPTVQGLFVPPTPSAPVDVPPPSFTRTMSHHQPMSGGSGVSNPLFSTSAPVSAWEGSGPSPSPPGGETIPLRSRGSSTHSQRERLDSDLGAALSAAVSQNLEEDTASVSSNEEPEKDDFNRLKTIRDKERRERYMQKLLARSVSAQQAVGESYADNEQLLVELSREAGRQDEQPGKQT